MTRLARTVRAAVRPRGGAEAAEDGMSLVELLVAMAIFTIVVSVFMAGLVTMTRNTVRTEITADASASVRRVFQRLDKQVRYADAINLPGNGPSGARYVEFRTPATVAASGVTTCTQWRWDPTAKVLQSRTWAQSAGSLPAWRVVATDVTVDSGVPGYPFQVLVAEPDHPRQSLRVNLLLTSDASAGQVSTESTFVARNSSVESAGNADTNADGVSDTPACWRSGLRP
ncbi:PulJ/GspJ family protein [Cellulomonas sp. NS3]|uniref:PulJ/GspJ family protein n=1 Tax=Cellulomonas sp. NS3 TaxID=2973977 RepID=UPI002163BCBA|nr:type II secretion system protein [Cellulomonas sp. NS3]